MPTYKRSNTFTNNCISFKYIPIPKPSLEVIFTTIERTTLNKLHETRKVEFWKYLRGNSISVACLRLKIHRSEWWKVSTECRSFSLILTRLSLAGNAWYANGRRRTNRDALLLLAGNPPESKLSGNSSGFSSLRRKGHWQPEVSTLEWEWLSYLHHRPIDRIHRRH